MVMVQSAVFSWTLTVLDLAMSSYKHSAQWVWPFDFKFNYVFPRRFPTTVAFHNAMQHCYLLASVKCGSVRECPINHFSVSFQVLERLLKIIVIKKFSLRLNCQISQHEIWLSILLMLVLWVSMIKFDQIKALLHQARHAGRHDPRHHATNSGAYTPYYTDCRGDHSCVRSSKDVLL